MRAAIVHGLGQTPVCADFPVPTPAEGERLIKVTAAALTQLARGRASGAHYSSSGAYPFVAGVDGVGRLEDGARVYFLSPRAPYGAFAEQTVVAAPQCLPLPDDLDDVTAAAIANPGMSSWAAFVDRARLAPGETVLVNGATGTSGRLAVQIAKHLGAKKVIATGRNPEALASLTALGADATIALSADDAALEESFRGAFAEKVDVVVDYLWGRSAELLLVRRQGRAEIGADPLRADRRRDRRADFASLRGAAFDADRNHGQRARQRAGSSLRRRDRRGVRGGEARQPASRNANCPARRDRERLDAGRRHAAHGVRSLAASPGRPG